MNILFFTTDPREASGGTSTVLRELSSYCHNEGMVVSNIHLANHEARIKEEGIDKYDVPIETPRTRFKLPHPSFIWGFAGTLVRLYYLLREIQPDVVNVHYIDAHSLYFFLLRPFFGYRIVLSAHGSDLLRPAGRIDELLLPLLLKNADGITTVSTVLKNKAGEFLSPRSRPVRVIPNGVDLSVWRNNRSHRELSSTGSIHIVHVGRLDHVKGQDVLVRAFSRFTSRHPDARLTLVGVGPMKAELQDLILELDLADKVRFAGELSPEDVQKILRQASLFVFPSRSEGLGIALIEAMACGVPIIASEVGGIPELITHQQTGLLIPHNDIEALTKAMNQLAQSPEYAEHLANNAQQEAQDFSLDRVLKEYHSVFSQTK